MIWRTVWKLLDIIVPMHFEVAEQRKRALFEAGASIMFGCVFLAMAGGLPREW